MEAKFTCPACGLGQQSAVDLESWDLGVVSVECDDCGEEVHQVSGLLEGVSAPAKSPLQDGLLREIRRFCSYKDTVQVSSGVLLNFIENKLAIRDSEIERLRSQLEAR